MGLQLEFLLLSVFSRSMLGQSECWQGAFTEEFCCKAPGGNPKCWDDIYTYDKCCRPASESGRGLNDSCWTGGYTAETCCSTAFPGGNPACWEGEYTYERCCSRKAHAIIHDMGEVDLPCWKGNYDLEKRCCSPFKDRGETAAICWQSGLSYDSCCKRDSNLVASLATLRRSQSVLKVEATVQLELPQRHSMCQENGGLVDKKVCEYLEQAEDMLRHQLDPTCWFGLFTRNNCCNPKLPGGRGHPQCWDSEHTFERCCLGQNPPVDILQEFYRCQHCISIFQQPAFTCQDMDLCWSKHGGTLVAMSSTGHLFGDRDANVLCLPNMGETVGVSAAAFALQWVKDHHRQPQLDLRASLDTTIRSILEVAVMLGPWLSFGISGWFFRCRSPQPLAKVSKVEQRERIIALEAARLIGTAAVVLLHLNTEYQANDPVFSPFMWQYAFRFVDIFDVLSVLVPQHHAEGLLGSVDALWRKLGRQLPLMLITMRAHMWTAGFCPHFESCVLVKDSRWSADSMVRWLTFSEHWQYSIDIKVWLVFRSIYWLNQHFAPGMAVVAVGFICLGIVVVQDAFRENIENQLWPYRLPMSLLVYVFSLKRMQLQQWALRHPLLWCSTAALLCSLGWVGYSPKHVETRWSYDLRDPCMCSGWAFFLGGVFFHLGVAMFCIAPAFFSMHGGLKWMVRCLSPLLPGILTEHMALFAVLNRCERGAAPWFFSLITPKRQTHETYHYDDSPRWFSLVWWPCGLVLCVLVAQVVLWTVQQPWERCLVQCPKPVSRALIFAYLLMFAWKESRKD